jgi:methyl-accepting chemotaxis protein
MKLLTRLRFSLKLVLMGLVLWMPALFLITVFVGQHGRDRAAAEREEVGVEYLTPLRRVLQHLAEHRGIVHAVLMGEAGLAQQIPAKQAAIAQDIEALEALESRYGQELRSAESWRRVKTAWDDLKPQALTLEPEDSFASHTAMLVDVLDFMAYIADTSGLLLDPEREGAELVDLAVIELPIVAEHLSALQERATGIATHGDLTSGLKTELIGQLALVEEALATIDGPETGLPGPLATIRDELLTKAKRFTEMVDAGLIQVAEGAPIAVEATQVSAAGDEAIAAAFKLADTATASLDDILSERVRHLSQDQYVPLIPAFCLMLAGLAVGIAVTRNVESSVEAAAAVASAIAHGDLSSTITVSGRDEGAWLLHELETMQGKLTEVTIEVRRTAAAVYSGAHQIVQGNTDLSTRTEEQASSLEETASSMEQFTGTVRQNADNAREANQLSVGAQEQAERGGAVVNAAIAAMAESNAAAKRIADIIGVIDEIAFQTNLLALNAAVEAARAGEQGRGFAVVAAEVRNLAQRSAGAAKEIKHLIEDSLRKVEDGSRLVDQSGAALGEIVGSVKKVSGIIAEIAAASLEQASGIEQVNRAIAQMDQATQQNAALVEQAAAASESLEEQANHLTEIMEFFKIRQSAADTAPRRVAHPSPAPERRAVGRPWSATRRPQMTSPEAKPATRPTAKRIAAGGGDGEEWEEF